MKRCSHCRKMKSRSSFYVDKTSKDGLHYYCIPCRKSVTSRWRVRNPERARELDRKIYKRKRASGSRQNYELKKAYGLSYKQYQSMLVAQGGLCAICKSPPNGRALDVDHNHNTKRVCGLLCWNCNRGLGLFKDTPETLKNAAFYLEFRSEYDARTSA